MDLPALRSLRIDRGSLRRGLLVSVGTVEITHPFANVAQHIIKTPCVGFLLAYRGGLTIGGRFVPCDFFKLLGIAFDTESVCSTGPAGVLPFGLRRQTVLLARIFGKPPAESHGIVPGHSHRRVLVLIAHCHITINRCRTGDGVDFLGLLFRFLCRNEVSFGADRFLIVGHKKLDCGLGCAEVKVIDADFVLWSFVVFSTGFVCGTAHPEIPGRDQNHVERYFFAGLGCDGLGKFLRRSILCCHRTRSHHDTQTNRHSGDGHKGTTFKHILSPHKNMSQTGRKSIFRIKPSLYSPASVPDSFRRRRRESAVPCRRDNLPAWADSRNRTH